MRFLTFVLCTLVYHGIFVSSCGQDAANCSIAVEGLMKNVDWPSAHKMETDKDVSFEMIGDNISNTLDQVGPDGL